MSPKPFPFNRPDHPDFWWLSELVIQIDGESRSAQHLKNITAEIIDPTSLEFVAFQRAMRALRIETRGQVDKHLPELTRLAGMYYEAFILGARFVANRKATPDDLKKDLSDD
jgi:hypothetical protein